MHLMVAVKVAVGGNAAVSVTATLYGPKRNPTHVTLGLLLIINLWVSLDMHIIIPLAMR